MFLKFKKLGIIVNIEHISWIYFDKKANVTKIHMNNRDCIEVDDDVTDYIIGTCKKYVQTI